ncbi:MAG: hypothetical protein FWC27_04820 [Firmicutes bacterium]|nr:hypothetical protein [Bacillota bacterium]
MKTQETTFESAYKTWKGEWAGGGALKMRLQGNTMAFEYRPIFYFDESCGWDGAKQQSVMANCAEAYRRWEGEYDIHGRTLTLVLNVCPEITEHKRAANVRFLPDKGSRSTMVPRSLIWRRNHCCVVTYRAHDMYRLDSYVAQHELGHVLGIFDAYGYGGHFKGKYVLGVSLEKLANKLLPAAPFELTPRESIMRAGGPVTPLEAEMILLAWSRGRLQLYTKSALTLLGAQVGVQGASNAARTA